jgi:hypothetical protein
MEQLPEIVRKVEIETKEVGIQASIEEEMECERKESVQVQHVLLPTPLLAANESPMAARLHFGVEAIDFHQHLALEAATAVVSWRSRAIKRAAVVMVTPVCNASVVSRLNTAVVQAAAWCLVTSVRGRWLAVSQWLCQQWLLWPQQL